MKIKSYKKLANNQYKIIFENEDIEVVFYDEIILKYNLLLKKELSKKEITKLKAENEPYACYYKAIQYLSKKNRSKKEMEMYLEKQKYNPQDIENTLMILEKKNILNEKSYIESYINTQLLMTFKGAKWIERKLLDLGLEKEAIAKELLKIKKEIWQERLEHLVQKKVKANKKDGIHKIKEKVLYYCMNEGYEKEEILLILERINYPKNNEYLEKEAIKLLKKLSIKYNGSSLKYQIKGRLLNKGFLLEDIEKVLEELKKSSNG